MKHIFLLLFCLGIADGLAAQTLLNDAKSMSAIFIDSVSKTDKRVALRSGVKINEELAFVIIKYLPNKDEYMGLISSITDTTLQDTILRKKLLKKLTESLNDGLENAFRGNPFIRMEITSQNAFSLSGSTNPNGTNLNAQASGFSVAGFADGLARFLVKRTKQELSQAFFNDFKEQVANDKYLSHFCPATAEHLQLIDQDVYQFKDYLESLRESFVVDMTALPGNMEGFLRDPALCVGCTQKAEGKVMIDLLHLGQQMVDGEAPIDMIDYLARANSAIQTADSTTEPVLYDMAGGLRFLNLISESLRNPESKDEMMPWYKGSEIREMFKNHKLFQIYLGLLWQKSETIVFTGGKATPPIKMRNILNAASKDVALFNNWRESLQSLGEATHSLQLSVRANANSPASASDDFFRYSECLTKLLHTVNETGTALLNRKGKDLIPKNYIFFMRQCNSLYFNVRQRNYTGAISNVIFCLSQLGSNNKEVATMLKYTNFVASIAEANSPEEVENAIELFALPAGSSRMKKQPGRFAVAVNAYAGLASGWEYLDGDAKPEGFGAVTAPVGLSFSWGMGCKKKNKNTNDTTRTNLGSLGFFVPLIDVGAVTAYRFNDKNTADLPELTWGNILSPGLYLVYDLPSKWPFALGYGAQLGPSLRKVTTGADNRSAWRQGFFATVDIPITYLYLGKGRK